MSRMCSPSAPRAPVPTKKKPPNVLLSRSQYGDLMVNDGGNLQDGGGPGAGSGGFRGNLWGAGSDVYSGFGRNPAAGLRIPGVTRT